MLKILCQVFTYKSWHTYLLFISKRTYARTQARWLTLTVQKKQSFESVFDMKVKSRDIAKIDFEYVKQWMMLHHFPHYIQAFCHWILKIKFLYTWKNIHCGSLKEIIRLIVDF
jgi:hypothetical protein